MRPSRRSSAPEEPPQPDTMAPHPPDHREDTMDVAAYAVPTAKAPLEPFIVSRRDVGPHDVRIDIAYAGICHSDIHQGREEWGGAIFPMVPGHEIAGVVAEVGCGRHRLRGRRPRRRRLLRRLLPGVRELPARASRATASVMPRTRTTAARWTRSPPPTAATRPRIVVDENYVLRIPESLGLDVAAPLLCAGITLLSAARRMARRPGRARGDRGPRRPRPHGRQDRRRHGSRRHADQPLSRARRPTATASARTTSCSPATGRP